MAGKGNIERKVTNPNGRPKGVRELLPRDWDIELLRLMVAEAGGWKKFAKELWERRHDKEAKGPNAIDFVHTAFKEERRAALGTAHIQGTVFIIKTSEQIIKRKKEQ